MIIVNFFTFVHELLDSPSYFIPQRARTLDKITYGHVFSLTDIQIKHVFARYLYVFTSNAKFVHRNINDKKIGLYSTQK